MFHNQIPNIMKKPEILLQFHYLSSKASSDFFISRIIRFLDSVEIKYTLENDDVYTTISFYIPIGMLNIFEAYYNLQVNIIKK